MGSIKYQNYGFRNSNHTIFWKVHEQSYFLSGVRCINQFRHKLYTSNQKFSNYLCNNALWLVLRADSSKILEFNWTVQKIDLCANHIGDDGVIAIAETLKTNSTLQEINAVELRWHFASSCNRCLDQATDFRCAGMLC